MINFNQYKVLTFDCYGTLIDWETGILKALYSLLYMHNIEIDENKILELYAQIEVQLEKAAYIKYKEILKNVVKQLGKELDFRPTTSELNTLVDSLKNWKPFPMALSTWMKPPCFSIIFLLIRQTQTCD